MKKLLAILMAAAMLFSLAACGGGETETTTLAPDAQTTEPVNTEPVVNTIEIAEDVEGVGEAILSNSYLEVTVPEGFGFYIDDANQEAGESQFQLILDIKNADGNKIGELLINNRGGFDNVDEYVNATVDEYADRSSVSVAADEEALSYGGFDVRHLTLDYGYQVDNRYYGYYQIPDENAEYRNVRFELEIMGYYYQDVEFPKAECEALMNSIVIK